MSIERLQNIMDRMSEGKYTGIKIGYICDRIAWLWKWRKIDYETMDKMTAQARYIIGLGIYD